MFAITQLSPQTDGDGAGASFPRIDMPAERATPGTPPVFRTLSRRFL